MRTVYVVNEHALPGEPVLIRKPDAGEIARAVWRRLWPDIRNTVDPEPRNLDLGDVAPLSPREFSRECEGTWLATETEPERRQRLAEHAGRFFRR